MSRALVDVVITLSRVGLKDHHASDAGAVTREKQFKGRRDAKKKAYAADAPARAARAAEEQAERRAAEAKRRAAAERRAAEEQAERRAAEAKRRAAAERRAAVVPPEPGSTKYFVNVSWETRRGLWKAVYNDEKPSQGERRNLHTLGYYPTAQLAARARYDHIRDKGLEQFNDMDALDDATDLMVPREKKPPKKRPVAAAPTRQSSRARKVSRAAEASGEQENIRF